MVAAARPHDAAHVQRLVFCPKCRFEELGDVVPGIIEVEHEWYVHVSVQGAPSTAALRVLRTVPELAAVSLTTLIQRLRGGVVTVGPFWGAEAHERLAEFREAGLIAERAGDSKVGK